MARDTTRPRPTPTDDDHGPRESDRCACGAQRDGSGRCRVTHQYPRWVLRQGVPMPVQRVQLVGDCCEICRGPLTWAGGCVACHGTRTTDKRDWRFPGARYERDGLHWAQVGAPGAVACTPEENHRAHQVMYAILAHTITLEEAHQRMVGIFGERYDPQEPGAADAL